MYVGARQLGRVAGRRGIDSVPGPNVVTASGGTANNFVKFSAAGVIVNAGLTDSGTNIAVSGARAFTLATAPATPAQNGAYQHSVAKAWVRFNGSTATIGQGFNVGSVVHNGAGNYTVKYSRAFNSANHVVVITCGTTATAGGSIFIGRLLTVGASTVGFLTENNLFVAADAPIVCLVAFGAQ